MTVGALTSVAVVGGLEDYQFELAGYRFGDGCPIFVDADGGFDPGTNTWLDQDSVSSLTGANRMGSDRRAAQVWSWTLHTNTDDPVEALAELGEMGRAWFGGDRSVRTVHMLRYRIAERTRVIFGRPRELSYKPGRLIYAGYLPPTATFVKSDALHYDDEEQSVDMRLGETTSGGFDWPAVWPLTFNITSDVVEPWAIIVGGDAPTAPVIEIYGPVTNPTVTIGKLKMRFTGSLPEGGMVRIDARPWSSDIFRSGPQGSLKLTADVRLASARLEPGAYDAVFTGEDDTGNARCRVLWRNAWHTL